MCHKVDAVHGSYCKPCHMRIRKASRDAMRAFVGTVGPCATCGKSAVLFLVQVLRCKECCRFEWRRTHENKKRRAQLFVTPLKAAPCTDCGGVFPPCVMDFDHRDPSQKKGNIGNMVGQGRSNASIASEIAKCDLVCANCHKIRTFQTKRLSHHTMRPPEAPLKKGPKSWSRRLEYSVGDLRDKLNSEEGPCPTPPSKP